MMENEVKLPKKVYDRLKIKKRKEFQKKVKIIFDKKQAMVRFPTVLVEELGLKEGTCFFISGKKGHGKSSIISLKEIIVTDERKKSKIETYIENSESKEDQILKVLLEHNYYLTTTQVAKLAGVSWNTAVAYLKKFLENQWINMQNRGRRQLWKAIPP
jgi:predicted transcriptional regulator